MIGENLLRHNLSNKKIAVWDTETESLSLSFAKPWQISWILYQGKNILETHDYYIKYPDLKVSIGAAKKTGFNAEIVEKEGKEPKEIIDLFSKYIYDPDIINIGSNILRFDIMIFDSIRKKLGYKSDFSYLNRSYDVDVLSKAYKLNMKPSKENFLAWQFGLANFRQRGLKTRVPIMCAELGIECDESKLHNAIYDASRTAAIFFDLIYKMDIE